MVKYLIDANVDATVSLADGSTSLTWMASHGKIEPMRLLVDAGVDVNEAANPEGTPLMVAASYNYLDVAKFLVEEAGADMLMSAEVDGRWMTATAVAAKEGSEEVGAYLSERQNKRIVAILERDVPSIWMLHPRLFKSIGSIEAPVPKAAMQTRVEDAIQRSYLLDCQAMEEYMHIGRHFF
mmetsp:Transcript_16799/g.31828  ORF Transcript_16799/g.31828 Transcript_16799/m.31828 type:complete len:181 (-) Transcript_16799:123-665(-)